MTDDDTLTCCPQCEAADIRVHSASTINHDGRPPRYQCHECGARFDAPAERRRESTTAANSGTAAAALEAANPDLVPDGGRDEIAVDDSKQYPRRCTRCQATIFSEREHDCVFRASNRDAVPLSDLRDMDAHRLIADADRRESLRYRIVSQHDDIRSQPGQTIVHIPPERTGSEIGQTTRSGRAPISVDNSSDVQRCMPTLPWCNDCWDQAAEGTKEELDGRPDECQHCDSTRVFWI